MRKAHNEHPLSISFCSTWKGAANTSISTCINPGQTWWGLCFLVVFFFLVFVCVFWCFVWLFGWVFFGGGMAGDMLACAFFSLRSTSNTKYEICNLWKCYLKLWQKLMCPLGLPWRHFWDMDSYHFLFIYCWEVFSPSCFTMLCKCFCTEAVKNNLILESISLSMAWWKGQICWCETGRVMVWLTFSSGNSRRFSSFPWKIVQWQFNVWCRESTQHRANSHFPGSAFNLSFFLLLAGSFTTEIRKLAYYWWRRCPPLKRELQGNRKL